MSQDSVDADDLFDSPEKPSDLKTCSVFLLPAVDTTNLSKGWRCCHCGGSWAKHNQTKVTAHLSNIAGESIATCDFNLTLGSTTYVKRCLENCERLLGFKPPKKASSPTSMEVKCYPELDTTDTLDDQGRQIYWSLIGMLQWAVTLGPIDIHHAVMSMSRFRAQPRKGHVMAVARIFGYLSNYKTASIKFRTEIPDYSKFIQEQETDFDWSYIYGKVKELVPKGMSKP